MGKTSETVRLEEKLANLAIEKNMFGCPEVTIGRFGRERVDFLMYDLKGYWRCYEIKVSVADFRSKSKLTFVGHFNYLVLPTMDLYEKIKGDVEEGIGVMVGTHIVKRAKKRELKVAEDIMYYSMMRSLYRIVKETVK